MSEIFTIELNLDDDFASCCAYHVDNLRNTIKRNIEHAETAQETNRWVLVGLACSMDEALEKTHKLHKILCEKHGRVLKTLEDLLYNMDNK